MNKEEIKSIREVNGMYCKKCGTVFTSLERWNIYGLNYFCCKDDIMLLVVVGYLPKGCTYDTSTTEKVN